MNSDYCPWAVCEHYGTCTGNSSLADNILSKKFKEIAPIFGSKIEGPDKFKSTIDGLFSVSALLMDTVSDACHHTALA